MRESRHSLETGGGRGSIEEEEARDLGKCGGRREGEGLEEDGGTGVVFLHLSMAANTSSTNCRTTCEKCHN